MSHRCETATIESLLEHAEWVRRLSIHLVRGDPEDAVQESWVAALGSPPGRDRPARPWLATVLRNVARKRFREDSSRKAREEKTGALAEEPPTPAQLLERAETSRLLGDLVLALEEPFRQVVLLRYYEGLSSAEIARALGVPAGTVRWRLKVSIDRLRASLDEKYGGDRTAWGLLLMPSTLGRGAAGVPAGLASAGFGFKVAAVGSLVALAAVIVVASRSPREEPAPLTSPPPPAPAAPAPQTRRPPARPTTTGPTARPPSRQPQPQAAAPGVSPKLERTPPLAPAAPGLAPLSPAEQARRRHAAEDALDTMMDGPVEPDPIDWPDEVPEPYRPDAFRRNVAQILHDCAIPAELVEVECEEPPCIATLRLRDPPEAHEFLGDCPLWQEAYGGRTAINQSHKTVACSDGSVERAAFVYRFWPALYQEHSGYLLRRLRERVRHLRDHWTCLQ